MLMERRNWVVLREANTYERRRQSPLGLDALEKKKILVTT